ncbi:agmatine deiminase family protein [Vibrio ostreicida]|uniref:Agmatine deiminase family protein n=1 Tax=Vibrio ostreicida TaxID=526588 RepID=A0ABT8BUH2_9VIBR|nr:agmatine deiminase family protein [Vibrio ostreicida]MDN3610422.1 agmatine deiminase family protein [Vibrio ostreicida]NPD07569.1 hypothetical protein [Vibrio ostreicida]
MYRKQEQLKFGAHLQALTKNGTLHSKIYKTDTPSPVRAVAEYEDMGGVLIAYPGTQSPKHIQQAPTGHREFGIPNELIVRMQQAETKEPVNLFILCAEENLYDTVLDELQRTASELAIPFSKERVHFVAWNTDTYWTRDYAPWWTYNKTDKTYAIAKHQYTSLGGGSVGLVEGAENVTAQEGHGIFRPNDDYAAVYFSDYLNAPIRKWNLAEWPDNENGPVTHSEINVHNWYNLGLLEVGGNYMVNSSGTLASTYLVAKQNELPLANGNPENPDTEEIDVRMQYILNQFNRFMGIDKYMALVDPSGTYIGHIDCWSKFLSEDTVLLARSDDPKTNKGYDQLEKLYIDNGFRVFRVLCQNIYVPQADQPATTAAYTNSLILNKCVYVPLAGGQYHDQDQQALAIYQEAMPNHTIIGIQGKPETPWLGTDALHCRTHGIPRTVVNNWLKSQFKD